MPKQTAKETVPSVFAMTDQVFRMHMQRRHRRGVGLWTRKNHETHHSKVAMSHVHKQ